MAEAEDHRTWMLTDQDDEREATWRERALNAEDALKATHADILTQRAHWRTPRSRPRLGNRMGRGSHPADHHRETPLSSSGSAN